MNISDSNDLTYGAECNDVNLSDLDVILLEITGENDGANWHWICKGPSTFAYIHGGCDYTGWDCRSSMERHDADTMDGVLRLVPQDERRVFENMLAKGEKQRNAPDDSAENQYY